MWRRRVVPRLDLKPQRVAGKQAAPRRIELALHDRTVADPRHIERLAHRVADLTGAAHAPARHLETRQAVVVAHVDHERLAERERQRRIAPRHATRLRPPLEARRNRSASTGPSRRIARPVESSGRLAAPHGSPGPRVQSVARAAAGASTVTVMLSPRRTTTRSTDRRTGARASASVSSGCQNAAARPAAGAEAMKSGAPTAPAPKAACTPSRARK